jgi:hypothetical protein
VKQQIEVPFVPAIVELVHEPFVFLRGCLNLEAINLSVILGADQLRPLAVWSFTCLFS